MNELQDDAARRLGFEYAKAKNVPVITYEELKKKLDEEA